MSRAPVFTQALIDCREKLLVGGKAANLGRLARLGFAVPDGFVVTTRAYRYAQEQSVGGSNGNGDSAPKAEALAPSPLYSGERVGVRGGLSNGAGLSVGSAPRTDSPETIRGADPTQSPSAQTAPHPALSPEYRGEGSESNAASVPTTLPPDVADEIRMTYRAIGGGSVAVRSSATAEDMAAASMAGQYETFLDIVGEEALLDAICRCWASLDSPRIRTYLAEHDIDPARVAMAVVVQRLVSADVAGVLFTANPHTGAMGEMLVEASWGLGESVVSGRVQPDVLRLEGKTGRVLAATIADKRVHLAAGAGHEQPVEESRRKLPCLRSRDVHRLWQVGLRVAERFGSPQDIEWAIHDGELYLLQSRPITTLAEAEAYEEVLRTTRQFLREQTKAGRGPWALHNLAETLAHPTPLTWSVICRFMSGSGGFGAMYRQVGFEPSPTVMRDGFLDCIGGRIYMDASRAAEMFFENFPFAYDLEELKRNPDASATPPTLPRGTFKAKMKAGRRLTLVNAKLQELSLDFDRQLNREIFPAFADWCEQEKKRDLTVLSAEQFIECWQHREKKVLDEFAPQSLLPSLISGMALAELRTFLAENFWDEDPDALSQLISSGGTPNRTVIADAELYVVGKQSENGTGGAAVIRGTGGPPVSFVSEEGNHGRAAHATDRGRAAHATLEQWIANHGHRAAGEFDLAARRWREQPEAAREMAVRLAGGAGPLERHRKHADDVNARIDALRAKLPPREQAEMNRLVDVVRRFVAFREDGKDFLMLGYDLLRDVALEAARRLEIGQDVFFLTREDLFDAVRVGFAPHHLIEQRKSAHQAESRLTLPRVIDEKSIDAIGQVAEVKTAGGYSAFAVSAGQAAGPARVVRSPTEAGDLGSGYILVCPSTDPSWTPLFVNAAGLVLECGGTLSHGAVVAREMGLPAVVLPDATRMFTDGEEIRVDGLHGSVSRASSDSAAGAVTGGDSGGNSSAHAKTAGEGTGGTANPDTALSGQGIMLRVDPITDSTTARGTNSPTASVDADKVQILHYMIPPPAGRKDRAAARIRNIFAVGWGLFLLAAFLILPDRWLYQPSLTALDWLLWPIARGLGKPAVVAIVSATLAALTLVVQKFVTDNRRLLEAKRRASALNKEAAKLPQDSPRRKALTQLASPVQLRTLMAALAPVAILLGPMVMTFFWFVERVDPATWNAEPGSDVKVVALIDSSFTGQVTLQPPAPLLLDEATDASWKVPPIRKTLEALKSILTEPRSESGIPWQASIAPDVGRDQTLVSLQAYLDEGVPPQPNTWQLRVPKELRGKLTGRFPITVVAENSPPTTITMVLGDDAPPALSTVSGAPGSPVKELQVKYPPRKVEPVFWQPLKGLAQFQNVPGMSWLAARQLGWIWVYVLAYLPTLFVLRAVLRVA